MSAAGSEIVPVKSLKHHPQNPRLGNVPAIAESLETNGQYKPILVHRQTRHVIAGNHTLKAAKSLGWSEIAVNWFDGTEREAAEVLLADNKAADEGLINEASAFAILQSLPDTVGTGYGPDDLTLPDLSPYNPPEQETPPASPAPAGPETGAVVLRLGPAKGLLDRAAWTEWRATLPRKATEAIEEILNRLSLIPPSTIAPARFPETAFMPINTLRPYPGNPNQGNVGLIMKLLERYGQTRPVVVSKRTNRILAGNHVVLSAEALGWDRVAVSWVDVDEDGEKRIILADNRTSQLATNSTEQLGELMAVLGPESILATGFTLSDLDDVLSGRTDPNERYSRQDMVLQVGTLRTRVQAQLVHDLELTPGQEVRELAAMLGLPSGSVQ